MIIQEGFYDFGMVRSVVVSEIRNHRGHRGSQGIAGNLFTANGGERTQGRSRCIVTDHSRYNFRMKLCKAVGVLLAILQLIPAFASAQQKPAAPPDPKSVTVPAAIDHNRVLIDVDIPASGGAGATQRVRAWVDNGNPDLEMSRHLASLLGLTISCNDRGCSSPSPQAIVIGGMTISLADVKQATLPPKTVGETVMDSGFNAELNIPSSVLRRYDVLVDFPGHKLSIGAPGTIHFLGSSGKVLVNAENGLIQIPSKIENKKHNLALDLGASIGFLSPELFDPLSAAHADWPHMTGAVGPANMWGGDDETLSKVMRMDRVQYGPLFLTDVAMVDMPKDRMEYFAKRASVETVGLLGANVFLNYRVGLDYAHSMVYFDIGRTYISTDFTVVGLTLRPEDDGQFTILGTVDFNGEPSVAQGAEGVQHGDHLVAVDGIPVHGSTMGQVWSMLRGMPGQERRLTVERGRKTFGVTANVREFLRVSEDDGGKKKR